MISFIIALIALGLIVTIHELGHFLFAKLFSVGVVSFSLGMGPKLVSKVYHNTEYALCALPIGGSCLMAGEELDESPEEGGGGSKGSEGYDRGHVHAASRDIVIDGRIYKDSEQFVRKKPWQRFLIIAGGPIFNFLLALILSFVICAGVGADIPAILNTEAGLPAAEAGLSKGDVISSIELDGKDASIYLSRDLYLFLYLNESSFSEDSLITIGYYDAEDGQHRTVSLYPEYDEAAGSYVMGIGYSLGYQKLDSLWDMLRYSFYNIRYCLVSALESVKMLVGGQASREDVMGPVRIVSTIDQTVDEASDYGLWALMMTLFNLMIIISASLGVTNLLPLPALDGGRLIFIIIELLSGRAVPKEIEARIHMAGMVLLLAAMVFIVFNDISFLI